MVLLSSWFACVHPGPDAAPAPLPPPAWLGQRSVVGSLPDVVAVVNGQSLTADELRAFDPSALAEAEAALGEAQREALGRLVLQTLVHQQAVAAGTDDDTWLAAAVRQKSEPVSEADVERFYAENQDQIAAPLSEVRDQLRGYLEQQQEQRIVGQLVTGLRRTASVELHLARPRVAVDGGGGPRLGPADAPVQIVEFSDFQCPYCAKASAVMKDVVATYGDRINLTYRHLPLEELHPQARPAAQAAACAAEQGRFWEFHDALFADRERWANGSFDLVADSAHVGRAELEGCLEAGRGRGAVDADIAAARLVGASGTPAFFINGIPLGGAQPFEAFAEIIDEELAGR